MKKAKNLFLIFILSGVIYSCSASETTTAPKPSTSTSSPAVSGSNSPSPTPSPIGFVTFKTRKETAEYLLCQAEAMREPEKPALLVDLVINMEKANPPIPDSEAMAVYNKHINDFIRIYPTIISACPLPTNK